MHCKSNTWILRSLRSLRMTPQSYSKNFWDTTLVRCSGSSRNEALDFGPAARMEFLAGPRMFGSGPARAVESLRLNDAGANPAGFHSPIRVRFEVGSAELAVAKFRFRRFRISCHSGLNTKRPAKWRGVLHHRRRPYGTRRGRCLSRSAHVPNRLQLSCAAARVQ
jgi:hypothetical protein